MSDVLDYEVLGEITRLVVSILVFTALAEAVGFALFYVSWPKGAFTPAEAVYVSAFHAVSAFCNAGFSLFNESFTHYRANPAINAILIGLIVVGGLGFVVLYNIAGVLRSRVRRRRACLLVRADTSGSRVQRNLHLHTKIVLVTTVFLLFVGWIGVLLIEWNGVLARLPLPERFMAGLFQSVTARTAGFNTVDTAGLSNAGLFLVVALMFVGASPGSTGGGIKTVTFAILVAAIWSTIRGRPRVEAFGRTIPASLVMRALAVAMLGVMVVVALVVALSFTEAAHASFREVVFEVMSAFGTVGLSTGITMKLTQAGRIIIILAMFVGRIGPLTFMLAVGGAMGAAARYEYPEGRVMIG